MAQALFVHVGGIFSKNQAKKGISDFQNGSTDNFKPNRENQNTNTVFKTLSIDCCFETRDPVAQIDGNLNQFATVV